MPHEGTSKKPTVEHRGDRVIPTHRWMRDASSPAANGDPGELTDAIAAVAAEQTTETYATGHTPSTPKVPRTTTIPLLGAVRLIAERCDGAHDKDLQGFNAGDTVFGRALAYVPVDQWEPETAWEAHRMLRKYRTQLAELGVTYETLPKPQRPESTETDGEVAKRGRKLVRDPYNEHQKEIKRVEREAERERRKAERTAAKQQQREAELAQHRRIVGDPEGGRFLVEMDGRDKEAREDLKASVPGRRFEWDTKLWTVPASSSTELVAYAQRWGFTMDGGTQTLADSQAQLLAEQQQDPNWEKRQNGTVDIVDGKLVINTPAYNPEFVSDVQKLDGRRWDGTNNIVDATPEAVALAQKYDLYLPQDVIDAVSEQQQAAARLTELSAAHDAELDIDGFNIDLFNYQKAGVLYALEAKRVLLGDEMGLGKGGTDDTKILTPTGWTTFKDVQVGDRVIGSDGKAHNVTGVFPRGELDVYRVTMGDGASVLCDADHLWQVTVDGQQTVVETRWLLETLTESGRVAGGVELAIPLVTPIHFECDAEAALSEVEAFAAGARAAAHGFTDRVLFGDLGVRVAALQGLAETTGVFTRDGLRLQRLSDGVVDNVVALVRSLGGTATTSANEQTVDVDVLLPCGLVPFSTPELAVLWALTPHHQPTRTIDAITPEGRANVTCIAVDAPDRLYVTDDFIVTHNTAQAMATIHSADAYPAVVVCPATLKRNWEREFGAAVDGKNVVVVDGRTPVDLDDADVVVVNYDILKHHLGALQELGLKAAVFDESHYVKNQKAARTIAALSLAEAIPDDGFVLALSGTPVTNRTAEFVSQLQLLGRLEEIAPKPTNPVGSFLFRYCGPEATGYQNTYTYKGASNSEELQEKLRACCYVRRRKRDVLKDLPPKTRQTTFVSLDATDEYKEYKEAEKDFAKFVADRLVRDLREKRRAENIANADDDDEYPEISVQDILDALDDDNAEYKRMGFRSKDEFETWSRARLKASAGETLAKTTILRQAIGKAKIPAAIERIDEFRESTGRKLVVFAHHTDVVDRLAEHYGAPKISGSVALADRQRAVDAFQNDPDTKVIVCNDRAAAEGITLTAASDVLMVEQDWIPMDQAEARVDRIGQTQPVTVHYLVADGTIDEDIHHLVEKKRAVVQAATDGATAVRQHDDMDAVLGFIGL